LEKPIDNQKVKEVATSSSFLKSNHGSNCSINFYHIRRFSLYFRRQLINARVEYIV